MSVEANDVELSKLNGERFAIDDVGRKKDSRLRSRSKKFLKRRFYILSWLPEYDRSKAIGDLIAGITIGLTMVPQSLAYANLANLPPQYGLYSAFMGSLIYVIFGTVKEVSIGPTSLMSILTVSYTFEKPIEYVLILTFVCGIVEFLMGVFKLGFIVDFISAPVVSSFSTATSLIVMGAQLKNLLGIKFAAKSFPITLMKLVENIKHVKAGDATVGVISIIFLIFLKRLREIELSPDRPGIKKTLFYLSISRNALIILITSYFAYYLSTEFQSVPFKLSEKVNAGIPSFELPKFHVEHENRTIGFVDICSDLGSGFIVLPLVSILANVAIAKAFTTGKIVDASQEMIALGLANFFGSFFKSIPTCGAFTRSAVSNASGVRTTFAGIYSAAMALLALTLLTPYFGYIPKTTLAAILICAVSSMVDFGIAKKLWKTDKIDFLSWLGCITVCIAVGIEVGLLFGVLLSILHVLYKSARPKTEVYIEGGVKGQQCIYVKPSSGLEFPGVDYLREHVSRALIATDAEIPITLDCSQIASLDYTSLKGIESMFKELKKQNQNLTILNLDENLEKKLDLCCK